MLNLLHHKDKEGKLGSHPILIPAKIRKENPVPVGLSFHQK
jgi:hypothetical protein